MSDYTVLTQNDNGEKKYLVRKAGYTGGGSSGTTIDAYTKTETDALLSEKQDKGDYALKSDLANKQDKGDYALASQIPDVSNFATQQELAEKASIQLAKDAGFPAARYDELTLGASVSSYIAPANGWFYVQKVSGQSYGWIYINTPSASYPAAAYNSAVHVSCIAPILKGQQADIGYNLTGTTMKFRFIYAEGEVEDA